MSQVKSNVDVGAGDIRISNRGVSFTFFCLPDRGHRVMVAGCSEAMGLHDLEDLLATVRLELARRRDTNVNHPTTNQ